MAHPHPVIYNSLLAMSADQRRIWLVYVADVAECQVNRFIAVPNYDDERRHAPPECAPVKDVMKEGDRVFTYDATKPGIVSLCEVVGPFTTTEPHPAYPTEHPTSWRRPLKILARFEDTPVSRAALVQLARANGWTDAPFNIDGKFKQGAVYCHEMPISVAESLAALIPKCPPKRIAKPYRTVLEALKG